MLSHGFNLDEIRFAPGHVRRVYSMICGNAMSVPVIGSVLLSAAWLQYYIGIVQSCAGSCHFKLSAKCSHDVGARVLKIGRARVSCEASHLRCCWFAAYVRIMYILGYTGGRQARARTRRMLKAPNARLQTPTVAVTSSEMRSRAL